MKHCSNCGHTVEYKVPPLDNRERAVCPSCGTIHYVNPRPVVGTVPVWGDKVLLCRRAIEPRSGYWTLPAGFMEIGESTAQGAARETLEEAGVAVQIDRLLSMIDVTMVEQIHIFYLATVTDPTLNPGEETLEAAYFDEAQIPWDSIAFPTVYKTLKAFFADRKGSLIQVHTKVIASSGRSTGWKMDSD